MTTAQKISVRGPEDILGYIPHALGYWPAESLVCVTLAGKRVGATLRLDLPPLRNRAGFIPYARRVARYLAADEAADGVLVAVFTSRPFRSAAPLPYRRLVEVLAEVLGEAGMPIHDGWCLGSDSWCNYFCADAQCCPPGGRPLAEITGSLLNAELVFRGSSYEKDAASAARTCAPSVPAAEAGQMVAAAAGFERRIAGRWLEERQFSATLAVWERFFDAPAAELRSSTGGFLLASLDCAGIRDSVLVQAAVGMEAALAGARACGLLAPSPDVPVEHGSSGDRALFGDGDSSGDGQSSCDDETAPGTSSGSAVLPEDSLPCTATQIPAATGPGSAGAPQAAEFGAVLVGESAARPDWERLERAYRVLALLGSCPTAVPRAASLTMRAWIEWCRGRGSRADVLLKEALEALPGYRLAVLLRELMATGHLCSWAKDKDTAWRRPDEPFSE